MAQTTSQRELNRLATTRYRESHREEMRQRRKNSWQEAKNDPAKMQKIQGHKSKYRQKHRVRLAEKQQCYVDQNRELVNLRARLRGTGIPIEEYQTLFKKQNGLCAICGGPELVVGRNLAVDHDHITGKVRGLLCGNCNKGLGMFHDRVEHLRAAIGYLAGHKP